MRETKLIGHWIDGTLREDHSERRGNVYDPASGKVTAEVSFADDRIVDLAVTAAVKALEEWRETSLMRRARVMFSIRQVLEAHVQDLAEIIASEHGKTHADALGEVQRGLEVVEFACGIPHLLKGEHAEHVSTGVNMYSILQPVGVVAGITPFNFPAMVPLWMYPVAIACGNTFILKPSEKDPSASIFMAQLLAEAGLPPGVFNVVQGDKLAVDALLTHPEVSAISSVSSTPVARYVYETASRHGKRVQALGGAKNHMVVLPDADMELAADGLVGAAYGSTGQRCMAISAVVAVGQAGDALVEKVRQRVAKLRVGPGADPDTEMGPLVTEAQRQRVLSYIEQGLAEGAELVIDGRGVAVEGHENGFFIGPCLFDHCTTDMTIYRDEIFGPVPVMTRVERLDDAIALVNANPYGNGAAIFTNDGGAAARFQHEIEIGMIGVNIPIPVPMPFFSFGGWKQSLFGDSHVYGREGVHFYTRTKVLTSRWPDPVARGVDLGFPSER